MSKPKNVYIVARYAMKPKDPSQTYKAGYIKDPDNMRWDERVDVVLGLKDRDLGMYQIILNITESRIIKNSFNNDKSFMELFQYFYTSSPKEISAALRNVGIVVGETKEESNEPVQQDVPSQEKEGERSESPASTEPVVPGKGAKGRKRKSVDDAAVTSESAS